MNNDNIQQILKLVSENPDIKGSFFEEILLTMQSGAFTDESKELDPATEEVVGEMNCLEKALQTLRKKYLDKDADIKTLLIKITLSDTHIGVVEGNSLRMELEKNVVHLNLAYEFLVSSIVDRFAHLARSESIGFAIRSGYQIVSIYDDPGKGIGLRDRDIAVMLAIGATCHSYQETEH